MYMGVNVCETGRQESEGEYNFRKRATLGEVLHGNAQTSKKPARAGQSQQNIKEDKEREECKEINLLLNLAQGQRYLLL